VRDLDFTCDCGDGRFMTGADNLSYMAHLVPDQEYDHFSGMVDDAIEKSGPAPRDKDRACMAWRKYAMLRVWQCYACGSVYVEAPDGAHHRFLPASADVPKQLFKRR
jgi:hypothetical protein